MEKLIAKRYIKALKDSSDITEMENITTLFSALSESFKDKKFVQIIDSPNVSMMDKSDILLKAVESAKSEKINNFMKLLIEHKRINIIPAIAEALRKDVALSTKTYEGIVYSNNDIDAKTIQELSSGLSKKFDSKISLVFIKNNFDGIKVNVEDLGVEINFSKTRINNQIIEHIIKAI
jgi:F-type H+-transporting ATPase subunit delta